MWLRTIFILLIVLLATSSSAFAGQTPEKQDSTRFYENIEAYSEVGNFTRFMYRLFFEPIVPDPVKNKGEKPIYARQEQKPYRVFEGKIIRNITVQALDPFGTSIGDTIHASLNWFSKTGNKLHVKSHSITIKNLLLIHHNQVFDSLLMKESERLVRSRNYIRDVAFFVESASPGSDSVDIYIRTLDIWSIIPSFSTSSSRTTIGFTDDNVIGLGHEFQNEIARNYSEADYSYHTRYSIPNIKNTYVSATLDYAVDGDRYFNKSLTIERPFFSPFTRWAGGVHFMQQFTNDSIPTGDALYRENRFKFNAQDYWVGAAIQLNRVNPAYRRGTNFISTIRFLRVRYLDKPGKTVDPQGFHSDENFFLGSIGVSARRYVQDKYIFKHGITEDVPVGKVYNLTGGYQEKNAIARFYLGGRFSLGDYFRWGFLSSNIELGTFIRASNANQGVIKMDVNYFTGLIEIGPWKFRHFVKPHLTVGINRLSLDRLTLNEEFGLSGFRSRDLTGASRLLLTIQTQSYAPWDFIGFTFGPFLNYSIGMLGNERMDFKNSPVYSQLGVGVLIKNEHLVMNSFQISISFYPRIPGVGRNVLKPNSFSTGDFGFQDFEIGKPAPVLFR
ncbi:hypothetical protein [Sunxiuqinia sp. sy24]|uniref:hypothetical protein n=1 Tax=Sunxiuqinia sp. sy24 TaxID=3461495 RepID=UPI0040451D36